MRVVLLAVALTWAGPACADSVRVAAEACAACHGPDGHSAGAIPALAGHPAEDMLKALAGFRDGSRPATIMDRIVRGYDDQQLAGIVATLSHSAKAKPKP